MQTELGTHMLSRGWLHDLVFTLMLALNPVEGSLTTMYALDSLELTLADSGAYLEPIGILTPLNKLAQDTRKARACWDATERLVARWETL